MRKVSGLEGLDWRLSELVVEEIEKLWRVMRGTTVNLNGGQHRRGSQTKEGIETTSGRGKIATSLRDTVTGLGQRIETEKDTDDIAQDRGPEIVKEDTKAIGGDGINPGLRVDMMTAGTEEITTDEIETGMNGGVGTIDICNVPFSFVYSFILALHRRPGVSFDPKLCITNRYPPTYSYL